MKDSKYKVIALMGKSASGKDTILNKIVEQYPNVHKIISSTTRPKRDYEVDGKDYFFLEKEEFAQKVYNFEMLEAVEFNNWFYGAETRGLDVNKVNIGAFSPEGIEALLSDSRLDVLCVYVLCSDKTRLIRSLNREKEPDIEEVIRRYYTDREDFSNLQFNYKIIVNTDSKPIEDTVASVVELIFNKFGRKKK